MHILETRLYRFVSEENRLVQSTLLEVAFNGNSVMPMQIEYCASNIGTTLDLSWHDNLGNIGMPIHILGWPNSYCKLGM